MLWQASLLHRGVHLPLESQSAIDPVLKLISCSAMAGISPSYGGVHLPLESQSAIDPVVKLISCNAMAGISPAFTGGSPSAFGIYKCNGSSNKNWSGVVLLQTSLLHWLGGGPSAYGMYMCMSLYISIDVPLHWYFLIYAYKFTVSNGLSLMTLNSKEFTLQSGSFDGGSICLWYLPVF